ncbi:hypothetical protein EJB05_51642 [Eragrostis curvula]|uniref:Uncharacterized protein n=1 Tax=Eragrostis curvula TaxID=38414 RepID=A0A5J9SV48_9POAL|nr:hypothetical protein EJB05_51642 [Eragrostis curvula]
MVPLLCDILSLFLHDGWRSSTAEEQGARKELLGGGAGRGSLPVLTPLSLSLLVWWRRRLRSGAPTWWRLHGSTSCGFQIRRRRAASKSGDVGRRQPSSLHGGCRATATRIGGERRGWIAGGLAAPAGGGAGSGGRSRPSPLSLASSGVDATADGLSATAGSFCPPLKAFIVPVKF